MRVAHFSDVHALAPGGAPPWQWLTKRFPGYVNVRLNKRDKHKLALFAALVDDLNRERPDHIVVTGDLTSLSLKQEFALARAQLDRLELGPAGVTVVPGNHDVYTLDALLDKSFWKSFAPYARGDAEAGSASAPGERAGVFPSVRVRGELVVVGVSTALPSPPPLADGWVGRAQIDAVEAALAAHAGRFRVVALHHPPYTNRVAILRGLRDRGALCAAIARAGCELVVHGHEHRDVQKHIDGPSGPIPVIGVGSGSYDDPRPDRRARYNLYTTDGTRLTRVETRVHDASDGKFH